METIGHSDRVKTINFRTIAGITLLLSGSVLFLDRFLKTGWLSLMILPVLGVFFYLWGIRLRRFGMILTGGLLGSIGIGGIAAWGTAIPLGLPGALSVPNTFHPFFMQLGMLLMYSGIGWGVVIITTSMLNLKPVWWAMIPGGVLGALGYCLLFSPMRWVDFVFYISLGVGLPLLIWGMISRLIGLVIPGCLILGAGPGVYMAWRSPITGNSRTQTGIMIGWFAFGLLLITAAGRWVTQKYIWWPLIPGGIMAMVGMGLYIGGDPGHALGFISNTGSIALMIFGLYLLLMRKGIHH